MEWDEDKGTVKYCVYTSSEYWCDVKDLLKWNNADLNERDYEEQCEEINETQSNQDIDKVVDIFRKEFCECCGSQRCSGQDDELVHCERFKNLMDNSGKPSVENHKMGPKSKLPSKYYEEIQTKRDMDKTIFMIGPVMAPDKVDDKLEYNIIDGYEFDKVENGKIILKPIKPKYPTTYEDCCKVLGISYRAQLSYTYPDVERGNIYLTKEKHLLDAFMKLRICRNAYWKIAGEEMGLDKPWEPDWEYEAQVKYMITTFNNELEFFSSIHSYVVGRRNHILSFPTIEMRDAFYENFKDLIEQCKELL